MKKTAVLGVAAVVVSLSVSLLLRQIPVAVATGGKTQPAAPQAKDEAARVASPAGSPAVVEVSATNQPPPVNGAQGVLAERDMLQPDGSIRHESIVRAEGKYPYRLVKETLLKDAESKQFVPSGRVEMVADHVLVHLRDGATTSDLDALNRQHGATVVQTLSDGRTFVVRLKEPTLDAVEQAIDFYAKASANVAYAEPDYVRHFCKLPNDPQYGDLWGMAKISAPAAWDIATGSTGVVVAVIDTGMNMDHLDLAPNLWTNPGEIAGDGVDNDGNGYVDDVHGWDFVSEDKDPEDGDGHGTHCAGTIGAVGNNANQVVGVCWRTGLMPLRVGTSQGLLDSDIVDGIRYAARNGAKVLSNSYGGPGYSQTVYDAVEYANNRGCIFVAAAGNNASNNDQMPFYPANYDLPNVISVAASDESDNLASFSNYGAATVDLAAPGVNIVSTYLNGGTETLQGTSMACPHVAGALALYASVDPQISPAAAKQILLASVDSVASLQGKVASGGRLNVHALFANANDADHDGMLDSWEQLYHVDDPNADPDHDFLTNLQEFQNGCNPTNADTDADSLIDGWEVRYGFNPLNVWGALPKLQYLGLAGVCKDTYDVAVQGRYAYVADGAFGLKILDIADPQSTTLVGTYATSGSARGVVVSGTTAYVCDAEKGFFAINVSNPSNPSLIAKCETALSYKAALGASHAYLAAGTNGMQVVNLASMQVVGSFTGNYDPNFKVNDVALVGSSLYMALDGGLGQISVANPVAPSGYSAIAIADGEGHRNCTSIFYDGTRLYLTLQDYGVFAYTLSKTLIGSYATPGSAEDVCASQGLVYVADGQKGLQILNAADPAHMASFSSYPGVLAYGVTVSDGQVFVAGRSASLQKLRSMADLDGDGMYDVWEIQNFGSLAQGAFDDFDHDGIVNWGEYLEGLDPTKADQDGDGLVDGDEVKGVYGYLTDPRKADTDGDGLSDSAEINTYHTDPTKADTDGDGMGDKWEIDHGLNPLLDDAALDPDGDGATNLKESQAGTDPHNPDTDGDGMYDGWEIDFGLNPLIDDAALDPDNDTLTNLQEYGYGTNPFKADTDDDGLTDPQEINVTHTDPTKADTDGDRMPDGWEVDHGLNPLVDDAAADLDGDGLTNYDEYLNGSNPHSADTDSDGFNDKWERDWGTQATNAADPIVVDDDDINDPEPRNPLISNTNENGTLWFPFDAIQKGIDHASDGMTVLVTNGYYIGSGNTDIDTKGKAITVRSWGDPLDTIIDADGLGAGFVFRSGESTNTVIKGFSITSPPGTCDGDCGFESGIVCANASSPVIADCYVFDCAISGIACSQSSSPVVTNTVVDNCGSGVNCSGGSSPRIADSAVYDCVAGIAAHDSSGLAVLDTIVSGCSGRGISVQNDPACRIEHCTVEDNLGGMRFENSRPLVDRCTIIDNIAPDYYSLGGSTLYWSSFNIALAAADSTGTMKDVANADENGAGILLGGGSALVLRNSVLARNNAVALDPDYPEKKSVPDYGLGGGLYVGENCVATNMNCTYGDNKARRGGGISRVAYTTDVVRNTVLWGNDTQDKWVESITYNTTNWVPGNISGGVTNWVQNVQTITTNVLMTVATPAYSSLHCRHGAFDIWYADIQNGGSYVKPAKYVIEANPLFTAGYALSAGSPCIDKGTITLAPTEDINGVARPLDGDNNGSAKVDIGAYEYVHPLADTDGDGVLDVDEIANGTDPTKVPSALTVFMAQYGLASTSADADGDGLSNLAEYLAGTNPLNGDTDGDHSPDGAEAIAGTNPLDAASYFRIADVAPLEGGGCRLRFDSVLGRTYTIYRCDSIGDAWNVVRSGIAGTGAPVEVDDASTNAVGFYKAEVAQ